MAHTPARSGQCPECRSPSEPAFRPFCSKRCADLDLARWLTGGYAIPDAAIPDESDDDTPEAGGAVI